MSQPAARTLEGDWYPGSIPANVSLDDTAYVQTSFSFHLYRSVEPEGVRIGRGASVYLGTMFDIGRHGRVAIGAFTLVNGARIVCDAAVEIGDCCLISWNVVLMDTYRLPRDVVKRRRALQRVPTLDPRRAETSVPGLPIRIGPNVWIGFDACVLPGVTIGAGSIVGARSVVSADVPPGTVVAGNPARVIRALEEGQAPWRA
jgi:acetyltransferase-like isoleucine patch superfamily enzyme